MRRIVLGKSGIGVSAVGLGGIQFSKITPLQTVRVIHAALDRGINFLETAHGYFDSEQKIGRALRGRRERVVLASKTSARDGATFTRHLEESLRRLGTDCIDIYQLHGVDTDESLRRALARGGAVAACRRAIRQGKVRSLGLTSHSMEITLKAAGMGVFESLQYPVSLVNTEVPRSGLLGKARRAGVGLIAMKPLGGGRIRDARLALGYVWRFRDVVPVVGVETQRQVEQLVRLAEGDGRLSRGDFDRIRAIRRRIGTRFCRACRYCEPCPQGISIFRVLYFPVYVMQMGAGRILARGIPDYLTQAATCTRCRACERRCPFGLHITDGLVESLALARRLIRRAAGA